MGNDELLNYISMFREKAEQGKLVIFVGAGVSCNVDGMPSWNALIQNMAKAIDYSRCDTCRHRLESCENTCLLKDDFSTDELLKVPQHVFNKDQELYYRILNESIPAVTADAPLSSAIFCHSIVTAKTYGLLQSSFSALSNIVLLLNLVVLDENSKEIIAASVEALLSDKIIAPIFFSIGWPDFRQSLRELSKLCSLLAFPHNFEFVHQIVGGEKFFEYAVNVHFNSLRHLIEQFISKDEATTDKIQAIIDTTEDFHKKVILLRLFYQQITGDTVQQKYKYILSDNFVQLPIEAIYDFIFSGWLTPDQNSIKEFLNGVIELSRKEVTGVHSYPNPVESRLECVYLLYINDMISDISALKELSEGRPHLQFLLDSESFDYSQVDFSNYMWENFARHEKYMSCFIAHKDAIIPIIQNRIKSEEASETEKRILYGFLLSGNEIWKI